MKKQLVKVVATAITGAGGGRLETKMARGISALRKDEKIIEYITAFLADRQVTSFTLNQRSENDWATTPIMYLNREPKLVLTFNFTQFQSDELGYYAKDLSKDEQARDFKTLKRYVK